MATSIKRVLLIFGTRPEAIKLWPVLRALREQPERFVARVCVTAQHREMLDQVLDLLSIVPDIDLNLMAPDQTLSALAGRVLTALDPVLVTEQPDWILVQGDTTTVAMAALAAQHRQIRVGHVEAGLRTYDRNNPFPEEMNRVIADHISDLCFAPTEGAAANLLREGIPPEKILVTGNTAVDAVQTLAAQPWSPPAGSPLHDLPSDRKLILVTAHRRESFGAPLAGILTALRRLAHTHVNQVHLVYPVHRNPNVWGPAHESLAGVPGVTLLPPVDYRTLVYLMQRSHFILTDSGGIQEEAPSLHKPVLILRTTTERPEVVDCGAAELVGTDPDRIVAAAGRLLDDAALYARMAATQNPFGDGHAAERIVAAL